MTTHVSQVRKLLLDSGFGWVFGSRQTKNGKTIRNLRVAEELKQLTLECGRENWDGHGGAPVAPETYEIARQLALALPENIPQPSTGVEADGHLTLEWYRDKRQVLSLSISPENNLYYAALIGESKRSGTEPFKGELPDDILRIVRRIFSV